MTWTKEPPTKDGYYWFAPSEAHKRRSIGEPTEPYPVRVVFTKNAGAYVPWDWEYDIPLKEFDGLWHPATPPALPVTNDDVATIGYVNTLIERMARIDGKVDGWNE